MISLRQLKGRLTGQSRIGADMTAIQEALEKVLLHSDPSREARVRHLAEIQARQA
jgi:hypothetical protein